MARIQDQAHPQEPRDRLVVERLLKGQPTDDNLAELGRLKVRYRGFPGARSLQKDLDFVLKQWGMTEEEVFEHTRKIHWEGSTYNHLRQGEEQQDWS